MALLGVVSDEPQALFDRIDLDYFSPAGLSDVEWERVGDCYIMGNSMSVGEYISYIITTESSPSNYYEHDLLMC